MASPCRFPFSVLFSVENKMNGNFPLFSLPANKPVLQFLPSLYRKRGIKDEGWTEHSPPFSPSRKEVLGFHLHFPFSPPPVRRDISVGKDSGLSTILLLFPCKGECPKRSHLLPFKPGEFKSERTVFPFILSRRKTRFIGRAISIFLKPRPRRKGKAGAFSLQSNMRRLTSVSPAFFFYLSSWWEDALKASFFPPRETRG